MSELYKRIESLCEEKGVSITKMCKESGANRASLTDLKKGRKQTLSAETLSLIGKYFNVSIEYLIGVADEYGLTADDWSLMGQLFCNARELKGKDISFCACDDIVTEDQVRAFENGAGVLTPKQLTVICGSLGLIPEDVFFGFAEKIFSPDHKDNSPSKKDKQDSNISDFTYAAHLYDGQLREEDKTMLIRMMETMAAANAKEDDNGETA